MLATSVLAGRLFLGSDTLEILWAKEARMIAITFRGGLWLCGFRDMIAETLGLILGVSPFSLQIMDLMLFEGFRFTHGIAADQELLQNFFLCDWSDYVVDHLGFQATLVCG